MSRHRKILKGMGTGLAVLLLILVLWVKRSPVAADYYAGRIYPGVSTALSWIASPFPFSLTELAIAAAIVAFIWLIVRAVVKKEHWWKCVLKELLLLVWVYIWFYGAWGANYYRSSLYARMGTVATPYEEAEFQEFLEEFAERLNENWCPVVLEDIGVRPDMGPAVKAFYASLPEECGLCKPQPWQRPKKQLFSRMYSGVGVLGFMGPVFDEMQLNREMTALEYPAVFAHEYSHLLGVTSEAEANFWAFECTRRSDDQAVRYSGYFLMLTATWSNIRSILGDEAFRDWTRTLRPEILDDIQYIRDYWKSRRWEWFSRVQGKLYNVFLRSNNIPDGTANYGQALRLVLTFSDLHEEDGQEE